MKFKRALVIGSSGTAGQSFIRQLNKKDIEVISLAKKNADYCIDLFNSDKIFQIVKDSTADLVVNCAANVSLLDCEENPSAAKYINAEIVEIMANACLKYGKKFVHISTDHFYVGDQKKLHTEKDEIKICNQYAKTKRLGEINALKFDESLIIRTNLTGIRGLRFRPTYFEWLYSALINGRPISLYTDFYTSTINSDLLSEFIIIACEKELSGIVNIACAECISKKEFALLLAEKLSLNIDYLKDYMQDSSVMNLTPTRANSLGLDCTLFENLINKKMPTARQVINDLVESIENEIC